MIRMVANNRINKNTANKTGTMEKDGKMYI
jgi:hypothetical protein